MLENKGVNKMGKVDRVYCNSSFLTLRYIEDDNFNYKEGLCHQNVQLMEDNQKVLVEKALDIDLAIKKQFDELKGKKIGLLLSGGMDSAILASYMTGCNAYTFTNNHDVFIQDTKRAEEYAKIYNLNLKYVNINWDIVLKNTPILMKNKCAPVHSIEPQIYEAALQAKKDEIDILITGDCADSIFGGMDIILSKNWLKKEFQEKYTFVEPSKVLKNFKTMDYVFDRYDKNSFMYIDFLLKVYATESSNSHYNAFNVAKLENCLPYAALKMKNGLDLERIRNGESKYLIRELFKMKYPNLDIPEKIPMPRPVDIYFKDWKGPTHSDFRNDINISLYDGNQKWLIYCLEWFLNLLDNGYFD